MRGASFELNCKGEGCEGAFAFIWRIVKGLFKLDMLECVDCGGDGDGAGAGGNALLAQTCDPIAEISMSSLQLEHFIVGRKLAGRMPSAASVAARDMIAGGDYVYGIIRSDSNSFQCLYVQHLVGRVETRENIQSLPESSPP